MRSLVMLAVMLCTTPVAHAAVLCVQGARGAAPAAGRGVLLLGDHDKHDDLVVHDDDDGNAARGQHHHDHVSNHGNDRDIPTAAHDDHDRPVIGLRA